MNTFESLSIADKLRFRKALTAWLRQPSLYQDELRTAKEAAEKNEKYGWQLSVNRQGLLTANSPENQRLSKKEKARFLAKAQNLTDAEAFSTKAAAAAIQHRGFVASVSPDGLLQATPPGAKAQRIIHGDILAATKKQKRFYGQFMGASGTAKA